MPYYICFLLACKLFVYIGLYFLISLSHVQKRRERRPQNRTALSD
jgi:hypothetical protein